MYGPQQATLIVTLRCNTPDTAIFNQKVIDFEQKTGSKSLKLKVFNVSWLLSANFTVKFKLGTETTAIFVQS